MLEVEKLLDAQAAADRSQVGAANLDKVENKLNQQVSDGSDNPPEDETPPDTPSDTPEEPPGEPAEGEETPEEGQAEEDQVAQESLTMLRQPSMEDFDDLKHYASIAANGLVDAIKYIGMLGITITPKIASGLYRGFIYASSFIIKHLFRSLYVIDKFLERRKNSHENLRKDLQGLRASLQEIQESGKEVDITEQLSTNTKVTDFLKIKDSVDFVANLAALERFMSVTIESADKAIKNDLDAVRYMVAAAGYVTADLSERVMQVPTFKDTEAQPLDNGLVCHRYKNLLPGDRIFSITLPNTEVISSNEMETADALFLQSGVNIAISEDYQSIDNVPYMDIAGLNNFLDSLEKTLASAENHQRYFEKLKEEKGKLRFTFRDYIKARLADAGGHSLKDTLVSMIKVRTSFMDKVYLVGMMDLSDYVGTTLSMGIRFAKENIKRLK